MIEVMLLWELILLLVAVDVVIIVRVIIKRRREKASIDRLVTLIKQDAERRKQETHKLLENKYGYSDEKLEQTTKKIVREEKRIYQILANLFTTRDCAAIEGLTVSFENAVEPYRTLEIPKPVEVSADVDDEESSVELQRLKELNKTLSDELGVTMNTISRMLHEYSGMFAKQGMDKNDQNAVAELFAVPSAQDDTLQEAKVNNAITETMDLATSVKVISPEEEVASTVSAKEGIENSKHSDSDMLVSMFQEDDDAFEQDEVQPIEKDEHASESGSEEAEKKSEPVEGLLAQETGDVQKKDSVDLIEAQTKLDDKDTAAEVTMDSVDELLAQAIGETLESHETPLPDFEAIESEAELLDSIEGDASDNQAVEAQHSEALNDFSEGMLDEDIDKLLQSANGDKIKQKE